MGARSIKKLIKLSLVIAGQVINPTLGVTDGVFIIGAPRSGTSCVAGVLQILGLNFGHNLCKPNSFNEKGVFEDKLLTKITIEMLSTLQMDGLHPRIVDWEKQSKKNEFKKKAKTFIQKFYHKRFGIKYPDAVLVLPIYLEAMQELGYTPKLIIVLRNPEEIVKSWQARWNCSKESAYGAIAKYYFNIIRYAQKHECLVIYFDDVIAITEQVVNKINSFIPGLKSYKEVQKELTEFIDGQLKHHNT